MNEAVPVTGRLNADANRRAANRNVLELRTNWRQEAVLETMFNDRVKGCEPLDFERLSAGVDRDDLVELPERNSTLSLAARLITKQIGNRRLG